MYWLIAGLGSRVWLEVWNDAAILNLHDSNGPNPVHGRVRDYFRDVRRIRSAMQADYLRGSLSVQRGMGDPRNASFSHSFYMVLVYGLFRAFKLYISDRVYMVLEVCTFPGPHIC